jgi:hypothetical protein
VTPDVLLFLGVIDVSDLAGLTKLFGKRRYVVPAFAIFQIARTWMINMQLVDILERAYP